MLFIILAICAGALLSIQTAINSQLRNVVGSPFIASLISFTVGTLVLTLIHFSNSAPNVSTALSIIKNEPSYIWMGGILGAIALTINILSFSKLGSLQTVIIPIVGLTITSMLIDNYGLFNSAVYPLSFPRLLGTGFVLAGTFLPTLASNRNVREKKKSNPPSSLWGWKLLSFSAGVLLAVQISLNGQLAGSLASPITAALISFSLGAMTLVILVLIQRVIGTKPQAKIELKEAPWWVWLGGILGSFYVLSNAYLAEMIGTGGTVVLTLLGQIMGGMLVESFGFFRSPKKSLSVWQFSGMLMMVLGIYLIRGI